jgi:hypothetical protein
MLEINLISTIIYDITISDLVTIISTTGGDILEIIINSESNEIKVFD